MLLSPPGDWANLRTVRFARSSARPYGGHWQSRRGSLISSAHPGDMLADPPEDRATAPLVGFPVGQLICVVARAPVVRACLG